MLSSKLKFALAAAMTLSVAMPVAARAELPHEKLHRFMFGDRDDNRDYENSDKKHRHRREERRHNHRDSRHDCHDHNRNGYCDVCGTRFTVVRPAPIRVYPQVRYEERRGYGYGSYGRYDRYDRRPIEFDVQIALRRKGYYRGPIDGDIGPGTRYAIRDYQYDYGLPVTGRIDRPLVRSLGLR